MPESRTILRDFQTRAVESATGFLSVCLEQLGRLHPERSDYTDQRKVVVNNQGGLLFEAPTGTGKTLMAGTTAEALSLGHRLIWFWFAPFDGLISQSAAALRGEFSNLRVRNLATDRAIEALAAGDVFLTTWASVAVADASSRRARTETESMPSVDDMLEQARAAGFKVGVVVDEAHHSFRTDTQAMRFYSEVLRPDLTILATATPNDADVSSFESRTGLTVQRIGVSRKQGVEAGLLKKGVKVGVFESRDEMASRLVDFRQTAVWQGVLQHLAIKQTLKDAGIDLVPLLLVQAENAGGEGATPDAIRQWLMQAGIANEKIRVHTADEPTGELLGIAHDESVEVLIFKMAVALGFDAPRSHTLVSLRSTRDADFAIQIVGRIMRVHRKIQASANVPEALNYGYVFLADPANQQGLLNAAQRIKSIQDELAPLTYAVQVDEYGRAYPSGPNGPQMVAEPNDGAPAPNPGGDSGERGDATPASNTPPGPSAPNPAPSPAQPPLFPMGPTTDGQTSSPGGPRSPTTAPVGAFTYPLRKDISFPNPFLSVQVDPTGQDILADMVNHFAMSPDLFEVAQMETQTVLLKSTELFEGTREAAQTVPGHVAQKLIAKYAQKTLFDVNGSGLLDVREVQTALEAKLKQYAMGTAHKPSFANSPDLIRQGIEKILVMRPSTVKKAMAAALSAHTQVLNAAPLPLAINHHEALDSSLLNLYGVFPPDLNSWERPFAEKLDNDTTGTVQWWHRNSVRQPHSVSLPVPGQIHNFYPDLIAGIQGRRSPGVLLIEIKRVINDPEHNAQDKSLVKHPEYGKVLMLYFTKETSTWQTVEYDSKTDKNVVERALNDFGLLQSYGIGGAT